MNWYNGFKHPPTEDPGKEVIIRLFPYYTPDFTQGRRSAGMGTENVFSHKQICIDLIDTLMKESQKGDYLYE